MTRPVLYGADYSVYVRIARLALLEKRVAHDVVAVDIFDPDLAREEHLQRHPFGRIPAFAHNGFTIYETQAITRYVDEAFDGPALQPATARQRARMNQAIGVIDAYAYRALVWGIFVERVRAPQEGRASDEAAIARAVETGRTCLAALAQLKGQQRWLAGADRTLADLHTAPVFAYLAEAPEGRTLLAQTPEMAAWWEQAQTLDSVRTVCRAAAAAP